MKVVHINMVEKPTEQYEQIVASEGVCVMGFIDFIIQGWRR